MFVYQLFIYYISMGIFEEYLFSQIQIYAYNLKNVRPREITSFKNVLEEPAHLPLETSRIVAVL